MEIKLSDHFTYKRLLRFTFPAMVMMVFTSLYGIVDGFFVANYAGKTALAGVNFVYPVLNILAIFGYMFGTGGSALVAKTLGEGKAEKANKLFSLFVYVCTALGIIFSLLGVFLLRPLLAMLGAEGEMLNEAVQYGNILLLSLPFWNLQFLFQIFFATAEKPKLGLWITFFAGGINMALDALFVAVFEWGLTGAAIATALSQLAGGGIPFLYFLQKNKSPLHLGKTNWDGPALFRGFTNGLSELVSGISGSLVGILYNTQLLRYAGEDGVAAYSIMMYVSFVFIGIFFGYANGTSPIAGYHYGAKNHEELHSLFKKSATLNLLTSAGMFVVAFLLSAPLSNLFAGQDPNLYDMTLHGFRIYAGSFLFSGTAILGSSFFTALNNGPVSAAISFLRTVVFQVGCVLLFPVFWGISGIWASVAAAEFLAATAATLFLIGNRKKYGY